MAILKKDAVAPERPVVVVLYGTPGSGKTSLATTSEEPVLIDTDRGYDRAVQRVDTLIATSWDDIAKDMESLRGYKTIIIDTAKAMLDDYLAAFAVQKNYKLATNSLKRFGQMADDFKLFVSTIRSYGADLIFICHDKETSEGDIVKHSPDCTGMSKDLLLRISDQVGYVSIVNNQRCVTFNPTDNFVGKNVAGLEAIQIPDSTDASFKNTMADIIKQVKVSIRNRSEAQRLANEQLAALREEMEKADTVDECNALAKKCKELPPVMQAPFAKEMIAAFEKKGFSIKDKKFVKNEATD